VRWYYSAQDGRCHEFVYGGCDGNRNRFVTEQQCASQCGSGGPIDLSVREREDPGTRLVLCLSDLLSCLETDRN